MDEHQDSDDRIDDFEDGLPPETRMLGLVLLVVALLLMIIGFIVMLYLLGH